MRGEGGARDVRQEITQALRFSKRGKLRGIYDMATRTITMLSCQTIEEALRAIAVMFSIEKQVMHV